ncbi:PQQ-binding-like beta-propeller repeat protein [Sphingomonas sp.]|uniref:outer membrane protein assembly factor BamB family protein n=1 Tax=Sphingomonas sp. TaxID=28214 RepID=UPI0037515335
MNARRVRTLSLSLLSAGLIVTAALAQQPSPPPAVSAHGVATADAYRDRNENIDPQTRKQGEGVYQTVCSGCHNVGINRAPQRFILEQMTPESIYRALVSGVMKQQAAGLSTVEKRNVAQYLTKRKFGEGAAITLPRMCKGKAALFDRSEPPVFANWGLNPASTHSIPTAVAGLDRRNVSKLKLKWALAFPNALRARSQPALAGGAIYVGSHDGTVFALDRETGCTRWTFNASAEVRTGLVVSPWKAGDAKAVPMVYFGDLVGNTYAVNAVTGKQVWRKAMDTHPSTTMTGTPTLYRGRLYVPVSSLEEGATGEINYPCCTFRGSIVAVDGRTGKERWRTYLVGEALARSQNGAGVNKFGPSGVPIWSSPAIDVKRQQLYVATGDNYSSPATAMSDAVVAIGLQTGKIKWSYQAFVNDAWNGSCDELVKLNCPDENGPDFDFGAGVVLAKASDGQDIVLAGAKSGVAYGIDPDTGTLKWKQKVGRGGVNGGIHFGLAAVDGTVFIPVSDVPDGKTYAEPANPGIYALDIGTGEYRWRAPSSNNLCRGRTACYPGYSGAITATPELIVGGANDGFLRIYDALNGKPLWEVDTARDFKTVNGTIGRGGSMGGGTAPLAYRGLLIMNSGYGFAGKMPGNVLLVYGVR